MELHSGKPIYLNRIPLTLTGKRDFCVCAHLPTALLLYKIGTAQRKEQKTTQTTFEALGVTYRKESDYLLPNVELPESPAIGVWGQQRHKYLMEHNHALYTALFIGGKLTAHLEKIDRMATKMFDQLIDQPKERSAGQTFFLRIYRLPQGDPFMYRPSAWWCTAPFCWYEDTAIAAYPKCQFSDFRTVQYLAINSHPLVNMFHPSFQKSFASAFPPYLISIFIVRKDTHADKCLTAPDRSNPGQFACPFMPLT